MTRDKTIKFATAIDDWTNTSNEKEIFGIRVSADENSFLRAYFYCMVWADAPENANLDPTDLDLDFAREETIEALAFYLKNKCFLNARTIDQAGHDLWLTRCGHGTGFWDRGDFYVMKENGVDYADLLDERARALGESYPEFTQSSLIREGVESDY
jgi:hypothetical protein